MNNIMNHFAGIFETIDLLTTTIENNRETLNTTHQAETIAIIARVQALNDDATALLADVQASLENDDD